MRQGCFCKTQIFFNKTSLPLQPHTVLRKLLANTQSCEDVKRHYEMGWSTGVSWCPRKRHYTKTSSVWQTIYKQKFIESNTTQSEGNILNLEARLNNSPMLTVISLKDTLNMRWQLAMSGLEIIIKQNQVDLKLLFIRPYLFFCW